MSIPIVTVAIYRVLGLINASRNKKSIFLAPLDSGVHPLEVPVCSHPIIVCLVLSAGQLEKGGETFWLNSRTVAHVVEGEKKLEIYAISIRFEPESEGNAGILDTANMAPVLIGTLPTTTASNFRYNNQAGRLVFSDSVYEDGNLTSVLEQDEAWEARGTSAYVYDTVFVRHWDTWVGPKHSSLFSVRLSLNPDREWLFDGQFINLLKGTKHVSPPYLSCMHPELRSWLIEFSC